MKTALKLLLMMLALPLIAQAKEVPIYSEQDKIIQVSTQQPQFTIKLKSNPTTGYTWFLKDPLPSFLEPISHRFQTGENPTLIGAPGYELWTFQLKTKNTQTSQQAILHFLYVRPWEKNKPGAELSFQVSSPDEARDFKPR